MSLDYSNLQGEVGNVRVSIVSVVGDQIFNDIRDPGLEVWFLVHFYVGVGDEYVFVRCLTQDFDNFRPFEWATVAGFGKFMFIGVSVGGGPFWADIGVRARDFVGRL